MSDAPVQDRPDPDRTEPDGPGEDAQEPDRPLAEHPAPQQSPPTPTVWQRPVPRYGEYAPEGWVNPVEVERARRERAAAEQRRAQASAGGVPSPGSRPGPPGSPDRRAGAPTSRFGASAGDVLVTILLLAFGFTTVVQQLFGISRTAATIADEIAARYTALAHPEALVPASALCAVVDLAVFVGVVWWSVARLRRHRIAFWVPLLGGAVAGAVSVVVYVVVLAHDPAYVTWMVTHSGI